MPEKRELPRDDRRSPAPWQLRSSPSAWPRAEEPHGKMISRGRCPPNLRKPANKLGPCREPAGNIQRLSANLLGSVCSSGSVPSGKADTLRRLRCSVSSVAASDRRSTAAATSQKFPWKDHLGEEKRPPPGVPPSFTGGIMFICLTKHIPLLRSCSHSLNACSKNFARP